MPEENQQQQQQQQQSDWRAGFGADAATVLKDFKEPGDFLKAYTGATTELTTLKGQQPTFDFRKELVDPAGLGNDAEKASKFLGRFNDKNAFIKSVLEAQSKLGERDVHRPLAKDAKPEEVAAWRQAHGIPNEPKGYFEKLPDGLVIGKEDQPFMDAYAKTFLENNVPPATAHALIQQYYAGEQAMKVEEAKVDRADQVKATEELRTLWGNDYKVNMSILDNFLEGLGPDVNAAFRDATLGDGTRLFNNSKAVQFLADAARKLNPAAHLIPAGGEGNMKSIDTEIAGWEKKMGDKNSDYWKGPQAEANQKRYRELVGARESLKKQA